MIGIVCAMPEEADGFLSLFAAAEIPGTDNKSTSGYTAVTVADQRLIITVAGLGKTNAAIAAATLIERHQCEALVCAGTAGGLDNTIGSRVVIGTELIQHDYGRSRGHGELELYRPGVPPLPSFANDEIAFRLPGDRLTRIRQLLGNRPDIRFGCFASGDTFVNDKKTRQRLIDLGAIAVDMECASIAQVAEHYSVPWLVAKGISDEASDDSHDDFLAGLTAASRHSASVVAALLPALMTNA